MQINDKMFRLEFWYRYSKATEKDFIVRLVEAENLEEAVKKGLAFFKGSCLAPFTVYHNDRKINLKTFTYENRIEA